MHQCDASKPHDRLGQWNVIRFKNVWVSSVVHKKMKWLQNMLLLLCGRWTNFVELPTINSNGASVKGIHSGSNSERRNIFQLNNNKKQNLLQWIKWVIKSFIIIKTASLSKRSFLQHHSNFWIIFSNEKKKETMQWKKQEQSSQSFCILFFFSL